MLQIRNPIPVVSALVMLAAVAVAAPARLPVILDTDIGTDIERRWWLAGKLSTNDVPPGSTRACRAVPCNDFDEKMGDPGALYKAVIFNPVPGPPMGRNTRLSFQYRLDRTDTLRIQIYSLTKGYHRQLILTDLPRGQWQSATVDMTQARRPDGSGGALSEDERIDDIQFYVDPSADLVIDNIVLYDAAPAHELRPFPRRIHFTGWFDTGKQGQEWPGDFQIVAHEKPLTWFAAKSVPHPQSDGAWLRIQLRGERPMGERISVRFRYRLTGGDQIKVELADSKQRFQTVLTGPASDQWSEATAEFAIPAEVGRQPRLVDEIRFLVGPRMQLLVDDVLLYEPDDAAQSVKAFPTAEGFGANARGGRGGRVMEVTNLDDAGPGSLRSCLEASGPRLCVFRVSGTITLKSEIQVRTPYLTVAGQTSPGGVQIKGTGQPDGDWGVWFVNGAHDIVVRHLRVRMGGNMKHDAGNNLLFYGTAEPGVHDVIVDHCSVSWGSDTQLDWYGSYLDRATFQWNLIGECYMGQHIGGNRAPKNLTLHHNLYANLGSRTPLMQHADVFDFRNNVIYNWSGNNASVFGQFALNTSAFGNVVANLWLAGPESGYPYLNVGNGGPVRLDGSAAEEVGTKLYLAGNWGPRCPTGCTNDWIGHGVNTWDYYELDHDGTTHLVNQAQYAAAKPFPVPLVTLDAVSNLLDKVLVTVGACKPWRDPLDLRVVRNVREKTGTSRVNTTGPWPDLANGAPAPPTDSDHDGIPDAWEIAHGLDPNNARDGAAAAANGYTNVENYLNELAGDPVPRVGKTPAAPARDPETARH